MYAMKNKWLVSLLAASLMATTASAEEVSWALTPTPNDGAAVDWLGVKTPSRSDGKKFRLDSFNLFVGFLKTNGTSYGVSTSYMIISKSNASETSVASSNVVAISTNAPTPANAYATYTFDGAELEPGTQYYLYWVTSNSPASTYSTTTQRLGVYKQSYEPGMYFSNTIRTDYSPAFHATLTPVEGSSQGTDEPDDPSGEDDTRQLLFDNAGSSVPYRIPALAQAVNGDVIALTDYRQGKMDIGFGAVDVHARISRDNGATWGKEFCIAGSNAISGSDSEYYGDASIVADSESDEVLVMLVSGTVGFTVSTREDPIRMKYARASYNAESDQWTWTAPVDITTTIYDKLPTAKALFFTSGKICQSKKIKVGSHYRIYSGLCVRTTSGGSTNYNYVMYSDDFGETWNVLGNSNTPAITSGDECKCEELPNGNVVLSSRVAKGRIFNIFTYTDQETGAGSWGTQQNPSSSNGGIYRYTDTNPCNGELLLVDAIRNSDNTPVTLALQSIAFNRSILFFYYKGLESESDYSSAANFAKNWEGSYQVSNSSPCYSTMVKQNNDRIGFYYEDTSYNGGYDMVYYRYPLETITNGAYSLLAEGQVILKCATPVLEYLKGKVICSCETEGVKYAYSISQNDTTGESTDGILDISQIVSVTLSVKAVREGYKDSNTSTLYIQLPDIGDVNQDGETTVADVTALVNTILSRPN